ncbi:hypothetical protein [Actinomadura sp.]|uniref:hypothetical protein n=1 Tax=Actinomadura sp. TaxID=1989 RepID=UPI0037C948AF
MIDGGGVLVAGLFSAKQKDFVEIMSVLVSEVEQLGGRIVGRFVQVEGSRATRKVMRPAARRTWIGLTRRGR